MVTAEERSDASHDHYQSSCTAKLSDDPFVFRQTATSTFLFIHLIDTSPHFAEEAYHPELKSLSGES
jgi:hypothetical protein